MSTDNQNEAARAALLASGWALYRPNGTMMHVYSQGGMSPDREDSILSRAWEEIRPPNYYAAGTPIPHAIDEARRLGYRVIHVFIIPNTDARSPDQRAGAGG
jgi:hypothetical protein